MVEPAVVVDRLVKVFGTVSAVNGLSFAVAPGEIYGLLGPNGAGKTTALRALAGLVNPTSGQVLVAGRDVGLVPMWTKAQIGFLSAGTGLYARLTGREVLEYFGQLHGMPIQTISERVHVLSGALNLGHLLDRRCETLSTGERQRVSLARTVLHDPPVLILDEPTNGLDVLAGRSLRGFVLEERRRGKAIVFSTHYLAEAELICDRVGLLFQGALLQEGTPAALRALAHTVSLEEAFLALVEAAATPAAHPNEPGSQ
jgi:ABC-type multidrug transport system ATPase subunit